MAKKDNNSNEFTSEFDGIGLDRKEKYRGTQKYNQYKEQYHIERLSDLALLSELVFREMLQERYKKKIESLQENLKAADAKGTTTKNTEVAPKSLTFALDANLTQILTLREKLGLFEDKKETDAFTYISILKKKFEIWKEEIGQASRSFPCPHCQKMIILNIKTDIYDAYKHPFFKDKVLSNDALWKLYKINKINKQDVAEVLGVHVEYIDWLERKIYKGNPC